MTLEELTDTFEFITDWEERYRIIIDLGKKLPPYPEEARDEEHKVKGCMSQVWMEYSTDGGAPPRYNFVADSDSFIVKGLIAILLMAYSGKTAGEIGQVDIDGVFKTLGLEQNISPNRRNGFFSMVKRIQALSQN